MVVNPLTGIDEEEQTFTTPGGTIFDVKQEPLIAEQVDVPDVREATVATPDKPIVQRGAEEIQPETITAPVPVGGTDEAGMADLRVTKIGEVLSGEERTSLIQAERGRIRDIKNISFDERNKMFRKLSEDVQSGAFFGGETQLEAERKRAEEETRRIQEQTGEAITTAEDVFRQDLERETTRIRQQGQRVIETVQRLNSLRGAGRGTFNEQAILDQETQISSLISAAEANSDLRLQQRRLQIEGASAEAQASINKRLASNELVLNQRIEEAIVKQAELNDLIGANFQESMESSLGLLQAGGEDVSNIDQQKSASLGYFVNRDGTIFLNKAQNPVEFKTGIETGQFTPVEIDSFAQGISSGKLKFSDLELDDRDIAKVISAMNVKLDDQPGLSTNRLKAQRILKDVGLTADAESVRTITNLLKVNSEQEVRDMISTDEFKNAAFVAGNQKLFDDLRKDAGSFKDIDRTFKGMESIFKDFQENPSENRAAMEQALIIMFNKMLDPGSVVREGEFDRTSQGQSIINQATGFLQRLVAGGAGITDEAFADIVNIAGVLHKASGETVEDLKTSYKSFAGDLGADPDFVDRFFEIGFDIKKPGITLDEESTGQLDSVFGAEEAPTGAVPVTTGFTTTSGFQFTPAGGFRTPDQTGGTKGEGKQSDILGNLAGQVTVVEKGGDNPVLGLSGGSLTFRTNNPLAITATGSGSAERLVNKFGALSNIFSPDASDNLVLNFRTEAEGLKAGRQLLEEKGSLTLDKLAESHTGTSAVGHKAQVEQQGLSLNKRFRDLSEADKNKVIEAFRIAEGFTRGQKLNS